MEKIKLAIACINAGGESDVAIVEVEATATEMLDNIHFERAIEAAENDGYCTPFICFDKADQKNIVRAMKEFGE